MKFPVQQINFPRPEDTENTTYRCEVTTSCKQVSRNSSWGPEKGRFMIIQQAFII